jgi:hypothetical protein
MAEKSHYIIVYQSTNLVYPHVYDEAMCSLSLARSNTYVQAPTETTQCGAGPMTRLGGVRHTPVSQPPRHPASPPSFILIQRLNIATVKNTVLSAN